MKMNVKLINYSQGTDGKNLLEQVAFAARVSNPSNQNNDVTAEKLVRYLIKHQHWSPLEMVSVCLEIDTTRDIARQILRHRSFSFQEFSQRYADASQLGFELREARMQDLKNRQNSIQTENQALAAWWETYQKKVIEVNIFHFDADIYENNITVFVYDYIRGEVKFEGLEGLKAQLNQDKVTAANLLKQYP